MVTGIVRLQNSVMAGFYFNWKVTLFSLIFTVLFTALGFWQLERADEKRLLRVQEMAMLSRAPEEGSSLGQTEGRNGLPVVLDGSFDPHLVLLLDNKVLKGVVGFEVLQRFRESATGMSFLVNRGFVAMGRSRSDLPVVPLVETGQVRVKGRVYRPMGTPFVLERETVAFSKTPVIVQTAPVAQLAAHLETGLYAHVIRLEAGQTGALPRFWPVSTITADKHQAYAIQWFAMAVAVAALWFYFSFRHQEAS